MGIILTKTQAPLTVGGTVEELNTEDKLEVISVTFRQAKECLPDYKTLLNEMNSYNIELPQAFDVPDLSKINKLYAITQSYISRVATIEMISIDNSTTWERLKNLMEGYIKDRECAILMSDEEIKELRNTKMQDAAIRQKLMKPFEALRKINDYYSESDSFRRSVDVKKKDLLSVLTNLTRQVKVLNLEKNPSGF